MDSHNHSAADDQSFLRHRPRRNRKVAAIRDMHRETTLTAGNLILPLFIHDGAPREPIGSMPGCFRHTIESLLEEITGAYADGIRSIVLFPKVPETLKTKDCREAYSDEGIVPRAIRAIKKKFPDVVVVTDVALDPYSPDGHDGFVINGEIDNDLTVKVLTKQAVSHAKAGADIIAPSDMMDGRIDAIRRGLDAAGYYRVSIMSYTAKYASGLYGPFRDALDSAPKSDPNIPKDKLTYQMDPANSREALRELRLDELEGADFVMVKPAIFYLDIISQIRAHTTLPVAAYQVSGEYAMIMAACQNGWLDERKVILESLLSIRRAGADVILTYFARQAARWLKE